MTKSNRFFHIEKNHKSDQPFLQDIGKSVLYKDFYMTGWSCRDVIPDDVELLPIIDGRGKQCRLMVTMGVARGIGDHDLVKSSFSNFISIFILFPSSYSLFILKTLHFVSDWKMKPN
jgi:hypothetical protein